jgi:PTH1 family peptidyl-tRNA hydrolase
MYLIAGLGNPGAKYEKNRHNVGFMVLDRLATANSAPSYRSRFQGSFSKLRLGNEDVGLLKPSTFMNLSGQSVQSAMHFFKLDIEHVVVVHDELDLPFGTIRIKRGGGTAGHNGIASVVTCCGSEFCRVRIGIGQTGRGGADYVLSDFSSEQGAQLPDVLDRASAALADIVSRGVQAAMNVHNQRSGSPG